MNQADGQIISQDCKPASGEGIQHLNKAGQNQSTIKCNCHKLPEPYQAQDRQYLDASQA
jgi:hypothetical protein